MRIRKIEKLPDSSKKLRVCAYVRVSTDSIKQGKSIENQIITFENQIQSNPEYVFVKVYADQGVSGTSEKRPQFQNMLEDCRAGRIDRILTKSISRFARNTTTVLKIVRELKDLGIGVYFEENNIDTLSDNGELMMSILASFAQEESRSMSENNKWSIKKKFERGEGMINTSRFMGYNKDSTGDLIINKEQAQIVRRIFELYLSGEGCHRIAKLLNEEGVKTITGSRWNDGTIKGMLQNEKYKGDFHLQKYYTPENKKNQRVKNHGEVQSYYITEDHPAIVSVKEWQQVQEIMEEHKRQKNNLGGVKYQNRYPMSGMLICPLCGKSLKRRYVFANKVEWICSTYIREGKKVCKGIRIRDAELAGLSFLEPMVVEEVYKNGSKYYGYTSKSAYAKGERAADRIKEESGSVLSSVNRSRRTVIELRESSKVLH